MSKQILLFLLSCALLPPMSLGQNMTSQYVGSSDFAWVSNIPNCVGATVCWHAMSASAGLYASRVYADNGHVAAITSSWAGYSYNDYPTNTWTYHPEWGSVYVLHYAGNGYLYGMTGSCAAGLGHYFTKWTGSAWQSIGGPNNCFRLEFSPAADGSDMVLGLDVNGYLWGATAYGASGFTRYAMPSGLTAISVAAISAFNQNYLLVLSDNSIWHFNAGAWTQLPGTALQITADAQGNIYMLGGQGYVNHWNGAAWDRISGAGKTFLANGGTMQIFAVGALSGGNSVYRFPDGTVRHFRTITGNATCQGSACSATHHDITAQAGWGTYYGGAIHDNGVPPTQSVNVRGSADVIDPFTCFEMPGTSACQPASTSNVHCSAVGDNFFRDSGAGTGLSLKFEFAHSRAKVMAPPTWSWLRLTYMYNSLASYCQTMPDDLNVRAGDYIGFWDGNAKAFDVAPLMYSLTGHAPWFRAFGSNIGTFLGGVPTPYDTDPGPKIHCDYNP